jgi:hypothetical protein
LNGKGPLGDKFIDAKDMNKDHNKGSKQRKEELLSH